MSAWFLHERNKLSINPTSVNTYNSHVFISLYKLTTCTLLQSWQCLQSEVINLSRIVPVCRSSLLEQNKTASLPRQFNDRWIQPPTLNQPALLSNGQRQNSFIEAGTCLTLFQKTKDEIVGFLNVFFFWMLQVLVASLSSNQNKRTWKRKKKLRLCCHLLFLFWMSSPNILNILM